MVLGTTSSFFVPPETEFKVTTPSTIMGAVCSCCARGLKRIFYKTLLIQCIGKPKDGLYDPDLADNEVEAVAELLQFLENVSK